MKAATSILLFIILTSAFSVGEKDYACQYNQEITSYGFKQLLGEVELGTTCAQKQLEEVPRDDESPFCFCRDTFENHEKLLGSLETKTEAYKKKLGQKAHEAVIAAFKSRELEIRDTMIRLDVHARRKNLSETDVYRVKECSTQKFFSKIESIIKNRRMCPNGKKSLALYLGSSNNEELGTLLSKYKKQLDDYSALAQENGSLTKEGFPLRNYYSLQTREQGFSLKDMGKSGADSIHNIAMATMNQQDVTKAYTNLLGDDSEYTTSPVRIFLGRN